ncbi:hypothetical protein BDW75DRAFT_235253 [Aspergillus navahoensis]
MSDLKISNLFSVDGLVAIVTGAGSGLGRTMALALDANGAAKVFGVGRRESSLQETAELAINKSIVPIRADISSKTDLEAATKAISAQTEYVDLLVANGAVVGPPIKAPSAKEDESPHSLTEIRDHLWSFSAEEFNQVMEINVAGSYYTALAFLPLLDAANKRRPAPEKNTPAAPTAQIIITSSIAGFGRRVPSSFPYSLSKAATNHLIKLLSTFLAPYLIRVNGIAPGLFHSEMSSFLFGASDTGVSDGSLPRDMIPLGRAGSQQDVASLLLWLAGPSGAYISGNITITDGGRVSTMPAVY